jgi:hypothetical protein
MLAITGVLETAGKIAGLGGLAMGVFLLLFRDVIRKDVFRRLSPDNSFRLFRLIVLLVFLFALVGLAAWCWLALRQQTTADTGSSMAPVPDLETDFPVKFGDTRDSVWAKLGSPQEARVVWDSYYSEGLNIYYDRHTKTVDGFHVAQLPSGVSYGGRVLGIRLGDSFNDARAAYGRPARWGLPEKDASLAVWERDNDRRLILAMSRCEPHAATIVSITYCQDSSFANYIPIVATTLHELRNGWPLTFAEEGGDPFFASKLSQHSPVFKLDYRIADAQLMPMGGATIAAEFGGAQVIWLWIYPVDWTQPRVRMIVKPDEIGEAEVPPTNPGQAPSKDIDALIEAIMRVESGADGVPKIGE